MQALSSVAQFIQGRIELFLGDITTLEVDAIVNAANKTLLGGGGVDGAIHRAAGPELLMECQRLYGCETGEVKLTAGYNLPAKYVLHAVGPVWSGGNRNEEALLKNCYTEALKIAVSKDIKSLAFPAISTGVYSYPVELATKIAVQVVLEFLRGSLVPEKVVFACFSDETFKVYSNELGKIAG